MCPKQTKQEEKPSVALPRPRPIEENRMCLFCGGPVEREIVDLDCSCFRHRLCRFCAFLAYDTPFFQVPGGLRNYSRELRSMLRRKESF